MVVSSESSKYSTGESYATLDTAHTRMNKHIASFPSDTLYDSSLISDTTVAKRTLHDLPTIEASESDDAKDTLSPPVIFFDTAGCEFYERSEADDTSPGEGSKMNENEAELVSKWARKLVSSFSAASLRPDRSRSALG